MRVTIVNDTKKNLAQVWWGSEVANHEEDFLETPQYIPTGDPDISEEVIAEFIALTYLDSVIAHATREGRWSKKNKNTGDTIYTDLTGKCKITISMSKAESAFLNKGWEYAGSTKDYPSVSLHRLLHFIPTVSFLHYRGREDEPGIFTDTDSDRGSYWLPHRTDWGNNEDPDSPNPLIYPPHSPRSAQVSDYGLRTISIITRAIRENFKLTNTPETNLAHSPYIKCTSTAGEASVTCTIDLLTLQKDLLLRFKQNESAAAVAITTAAKHEVAAAAASNAATILALTPPVNPNATAAAQKIAADALAKAQQEKNAADKAAAALEAKRLVAEKNAADAAIAAEKIRQQSVFSRICSRTDPNP